jgi:hypothetical protein
MEMKASIQCTALVLPYGVKQAAKRQAKQCTALFCPHSLTVNFLLRRGNEAQTSLRANLRREGTSAERIRLCQNSKNRNDTAIYSVIKPCNKESNAIYGSNNDF